MKYFRQDLSLCYLKTVYTIIGFTSVLVANYVMRIRADK